MIFSKQKCYCRACGAELFISLAGPGWKDVCGSECHAEMTWREALSIMGKEYYPRPTDEKIQSTQ